MRIGSDIFVTLKLVSELRFEQPVKIEHLTQAHLFSKKLELKLKRVAFCFAWDQEDAGLIEVMKSLKEKAKLNKLNHFSYMFQGTKTF